MDHKNDTHKAGERIAKVIARAGLASRREAELWIAAGRVAVNGAVINSPAYNVTARDRVSVDGEPLPARERTRLFLYHKPRGLMTTHADPRGRPTIFARLPRHLPRLISVGRLDFNTEGLLLLTNDGVLARVLELPATGWLRRYRVRAHGSVTQAELDALHAGVTVDGIHYGAIDASLDRVQGSNLWLTFAIREGKNREVRKVLGQLGLTVTRLIRVSFGPFQLGELAEGAIEEVRTRVLREQLGPRLVAQSGADFSTPVAGPPAVSQQGPRTLPQHKPASHAWRAHEDERPKKPLRRKFRGSRRDAEHPRHQPAGPVRTDLLTDRKGRRVSVERHGEPPPPKPANQEAPRRGGRGRRVAPDRSAGPRPRQPRGRR
jgi:23S rRNA pseudouridine2605 synthase